MRRKLVAGNWKMHGSLAENEALLSGVLAGLGSVKAGVAVCVPYPYLAQVQARLTGSAVAWGTQNLSQHGKGAFTGEVSAAMLKDFGCAYVIVGHSERRQYHAEGDQLVADKAKAALSRGVTPIVCVGETLAQREAGETDQVVKRQLSAVIHTLGHCAGEMVVAYEPVWAIGTGLTPTAAEVAEVHAAIRAELEARFGAEGKGMRILYGGSVKPSNAAELMAVAHVNGALVGGGQVEVGNGVEEPRGEVRNFLYVDRGPFEKDAHNQAVGRLSGARGLWVASVLLKGSAGENSDTPQVHAEVGRNDGEVCDDVVEFRVEIGRKTGRGRVGGRRGLHGGGGDHGEYL